MANYSYSSRSMGNHRWIAYLRIVSGNSVSASHWSEIHFTEPKKAQVQASLRPHVTFEQQNGNKSHWYLKNTGGQWDLERGGASSPDAGLEQTIAYNVLSDALELNWILQAPPSVVTDEEGFVTSESKGRRRKRMQTQWKR